MACGEERVKDAVDVSRAMPAPYPLLDSTLRMRCGTDFELPPLACVARVQEKVQEDLLQLVS